MTKHKYIIKTNLEITNCEGCPCSTMNVAKYLICQLKRNVDCSENKLPNDCPLERTKQ